jgi:hypothetical protein
MKGQYENHTSKKQLFDVLYNCGENAYIGCARCATPLNNVLCMLIYICTLFYKIFKLN